MDPVLSHHTSQERQPATMPELPNNKPHQSPKQSHAEGHFALSVLSETVTINKGCTVCSERMTIDDGGTGSQIIARGGKIW